MPQILKDGSAEDKSICSRGSESMSQVEYGVVSSSIVYVLLQMMPPKRLACNRSIVEHAQGPICQAFVSAQSC